jgi:hypothetical protein
MSYGPIIIPDLAAIQARYDATSQEEWLIKKVGSDALGWHYSLCGWDTDAVEKTEANVTFMAYAHQDVPAMLWQIKQLKDDRTMFGEIATAFKRAMERVAAQGHHATCSGIRGGECGCHVGIATDALRGQR